MCSSYMMDKVEFWVAKIKCRHYLDGEGLIYSDQMLLFSFVYCLGLYKI